ncbi:MAG: FAD-dependent oxidoreductase [Halopseudomonas sp.]
MSPLQSRHLPDDDNGYDLLVVGGGIQGAGMAQAASAAGYSVLLVERDDWGCGTSSRSSKLIHGGLRYLESGQFALVRKALKERQVLLNIAPELVKPVPFVIPVYRHSQRTDMMLYTGLQLYRWLGRGLVYNDFDRFEPDDPQFDSLCGGGLIRQDLRAVYRYWDAQTDDKMLTRSVATSASTLGAKLARGWSLTHAQPCDYGWRVDLSDGNSYRRVEASVLINATGPWVSQVQTLIHSAPAPLSTELVQGAHILVEGRLGDSVFYLETEDRRGVFVMPWQQDSLVGTTETPYVGDPSQCRVLPQEVDYLRDALRRYFPELTVKIKSQFAGLRVLEGGNGGFFHRARDTRLQEFWHEGRGLVSLYGGKLTTYRTTAQAVIKRLEPHLGKRQPLADTATLQLVPVEAANA